MHLESILSLARGSSEAFIFIVRGMEPSCILRRLLCKSDRLIGLNHISKLKVCKNVVGKNKSTCSLYIVKLQTLCEVIIIIIEFNKYIFEFDCFSR